MYPEGIAVDASGDVYVSDEFGHRIQKFTETGAFISSWSTDIYAGAGSSLPFAIAIDLSGNVYVADGGNHRVLKFTSAGAYLTHWGTVGTGNGQFGPPYGPLGLAVGPTGNVYVADTYNMRLQVFHKLRQLSEHLELRTEREHQPTARRGGGPKWRCLCRRREQ